MEWGPLRGSPITPMPTFTPPTVDGTARADLSRPDPANRLMRYYGAHPAGVAVWKTPEGEWRVSESVTVEDQRAAVVYYGGGHVHVISEEEADELTAAGFGAYITP